MAVFRDRFVDCTDVAEVRVLSPQAGRVTVTPMERPSSDVAAGRRLDIRKNLPE